MRDVNGNEIDVEGNTCISCSKLCECDNCCLVPWMKSDKYVTDTGECLCRRCHSDYEKSKKIMEIIISERKYRVPYDYEPPRRSIS